MDLGFLKSQGLINFGGILWVPVHTDVNFWIPKGDDEEGNYDRNENSVYTDNPDLLFPWEGPLDVVYSEHRQLALSGSPGWERAAIGILETMRVRVTGEDWNQPGQHNYTTPNQAAITSSYAPAQIPEEWVNGVYNKTYSQFAAITIGWYFLGVNLSDGWGYGNFNHRGDPATHTCFGYISGVNEICIP